MPGESKITRSLFAGLQIIRPGEIAPTHRHVASALRFIIEGEGAFTAVDGEKTMMSQGDFVITPSWTWHDHGNESEQLMVWLDGLDMHIVNMCDASFREDYAGGTSPVTRPDGAAAAEAGCNLLPLDYRHGSQTTPIFNYPYRVSREALHSMARFRDPDPCHGFAMQYINPLTGGSAMPTITTTIRLLPKGMTTTAYRSTASTVFTVVEGEGLAHCGGKTFHWHARDLFVIPSWHTFVLECKSESVLFSYSDRIVQEKLDFFREERADG
jgi:gentisate 1,2-dioxygenase